MDAAENRKKQVCPGLSDPRVSVIFGNADLTELLKSILLRKLNENSGDANAQNRQK